MRTLKAKATRTFILVLIILFHKMIFNVFRACVFSSLQHLENNIPSHNICKITALFLAEFALWKGFQTLAVGLILPRVEKKKIYFRDQTIRKPYAVMLENISYKLKVIKMN